MEEIIDTCFIKLLLDIKDINTAEFIINYLNSNNNFQITTNKLLKLKEKDEIIICGKFELLDAQKL